MNSERFWILYSRKQAGEASAEELRELENLDEQRHFSLEVLEKWWSKPLESRPEMTAGPAVWEKINQATAAEPAARHFSLYPFRWVAAACILLLFAGGIFYYSGISRSAKDKPVVAAMQTLASAPESKLRQLLPDGTVVWLNRNSRLDYNTAAFGKQFREVNLSGEAFFDVAHNAHIPFVIHAMNVNITVRGTAFNVRAYPNQRNVETSLIRGLIELTTREDPERKILVRPNEKILIPETQPAVPTPSAPQIPYQIDLLKKDKKEKIAETVWLEPRLEFDNESFSSIVPKLESWYGVSIRFDDPALSKRRFTASIEKETLEETLHAMQLSSPFVFSREENRVIITGKGAH